MGGDPILAAKIAAFAAGMKAKSGDLTRGDVDQLQDQIDRDLDAEDPLYRSLSSFLIDCGVHLRDPVKLAEIGADLCHHIETLNVPQPPDLNRRDIYG